MEFAIGMFVGILICGIAVILGGDLKR